MASSTGDAVANCTFDPSDTLRFPYEFINASGSTITQGIPVMVTGFAEPVCVFATGCSSDPNCCSTTAELESDATVYWIIALFFLGPYILVQSWAGWKRRRRRRHMLALGKTATEIEADGEGWKLLMAAVGSHYHPAVKLVIGLAVAGVVVATVFEAVTVPKSIQ